jgi:hypothetical protein
MFRRRRARIVWIPRIEPVAPVNATMILGREGLSFSIVCRDGGGRVGLVGEEVHCKEFALDRRAMAGIAK